MPALKRIRYFADLSPGTGYNNAARGYIRALEVLGYSPENLHLVPAILTTVDRSLEAGDPMRTYAISPWPDPEEINIVHLNPGLIANYYTKGRYNIAITSWETNKLPGAKYTPPCMDSGPLSPVEAMNLFEEVWVPSQFVRGVFAKDGVEESKLRVVPHCLYYKIPPRKLENEVLRRGVRFYYIGSWNARKNAANLLRAYWMTKWSTASPVSLFLHAVPPTRDPNILEANDWLVRSEIDNLREAISVVRRMNLPSYAPSTQFRPAQWIQDAHAHSDVFITASRGEGFGLGFVEALAHGNLIVGGGGPVFNEFRDSLGSLKNLMCHKLRDQLVPITPMPEMLGYELDQEWWDVSIVTLTEAFEKIFVMLQDKSTDWAGIRMEAAAKIQEAYSPERIAEAFKGSLAG